MAPFRLLTEVIKNKRANAGVVIGVVSVLLLITVMVPIGVYITYTMQSTVTSLGMTPNSAADNASDAVFDRAWVGYNLVSILSIVIAAVAIITAVIGAFVTRRVD